MKQIVFLASFQKSFERLTADEQKLLRNGFEAFSDFLENSIVPHGLGYKSLGRGICEVRVDKRLRVIMQIIESDYYVVFVGNHDQVRKYLKNV